MLVGYAIYKSTFLPRPYNLALGIGELLGGCGSSCSA